MKWFHYTFSIPYLYLLIDLFYNTPEVTGPAFLCDYRFFYALYRKTADHLVSSC